MAHLERYIAPTDYAMVVVQVGTAYCRRCYSYNSIGWRVDSWSGDLLYSHMVRFAFPYYGLHSLAWSRHRVSRQCGKAVDVEGGSLRRRIDTNLEDWDISI